MLVIEARSDAVKSNIAGMLVQESRQIGSGQTVDGKSERRDPRNQRTKMDWNGWIFLTQMTIISTTVGRNPLEEME